ncbi:alpha-amylase family glycosyl hydrolase [Maricaulis sp.]|uniref:alpha-amylase family glycosyl hydrolase n=1 Tax=Maricaulis sp. TaxID=1486257 RepID=UPI0026137B30|nr:alpha-amylase family glycosyl hydrolase [Maricaulis sp.]
MQVLQKLKPSILSSLTALCLTTAACAQPAQNAGIADSDRGPQDEIIYFVLPDRFENANPENDRGGIDGNRMQHGFDPTDTGFFHGGDLAGLTARLDYIQGLGATAVWLTPIFHNKAVQGEDDWASAGYHGYWVTDFSRPDAHLGTREEFRAFVDAAHARGMRVYMDIITNHTADVIAYRECHDPSSALYIDPQGPCPYRSRADYPFTTRGDADGEPINDGFLGDDPAHLTDENFARLTDPDFAYTPFYPVADERGALVPAWLNDMTLYHNRGDSFWWGESALYGDFVGLDDLNTEHPVVVEGMIEIYKEWITEFRIDGFRIDTVKHVRPEFWAEFTPAIIEHAHDLGIDHFFVFGEVNVTGNGATIEAGQLTRFTQEGGMPSVLDFAVQQAIQEVVIDGRPGELFEHVFNFDHSYAGGAETGLILPTFVSNHDMGRFAGFLQDAAPGMADEERFARVRLAHAMMMFMRGIPTIYYGDEQGFVSDGHDRGARENMFASQVESYNDNDLIGTDATTADANFDTRHPLYRSLAQMAAIRTATPALRRGQQIVRFAGREDGIIALSRLHEESGEEVIIVFNAEQEPVTMNITVDGRSTAWEGLAGGCETSSRTTASYAVTVPPLDFIVCRSSWVGDD